MVKQDFVDFLLQVGSGGQISQTPSSIKPSSSPKNRAELALLKVPELKSLALNYGLKKFKDKTPSQLRKNDFIDFIILATQKQKSRSPSLEKPKSSKSRSLSPKYKSKLEESEDAIVVKKIAKKKTLKRSPPASVRRSRSSRRRSKSPPASVRRSRSPSVVKPKGIRPDLPKYTGENAEHDLETLAQAYNYEVVPVKGDGNCLFRAVSKSLRLNQNLKYNHKILRKMVVDYLSQNPDFLELYLGYVNGMTPQEYINNMANLGTWGDFICLIALSEILKIQFNLLILNTKNFQIISNNDSYTSMVPLGFIDDYHYTALVPITPSVKPPSIKPSILPPSIKPSIKPSILPPSIKPSILPPSIKPSIKPSASIKPSILPPSIKPSIKPSASIKSITIPKITPSIAPKIPPPIFGPIKPLSSTRELLEEADKIQPYVREDISQLAKAEEQILISLGM
jgi:OTU-like cysteine protease